MEQFVFSRDLETKKQTPDCLCHTCDRDIHHLGIMSHRAMHRRKLEDCKITFSTGRTFTYRFAKQCESAIAPRHPQQSDTVEN